MDQFISHQQNPKGQCRKFKVTPSDIDFWCATRVHPWASSVYYIPVHWAPTARKHYIIYHLHADDQQIYLSFKLAKTRDKENCIKRLETCIAEIREWMTANMPKLNDDKTEFMIFGTKQQLAKIGEVSIAISSIQVQLVDQVRNL